MMHVTKFWNFFIPSLLYFLPGNPLPPILCYLIYEQLLVNYDTKI
jgi:hypothetical protein